MFLPAPQTQVVEGVGEDRGDALAVLEGEHGEDDDSDEDRDDDDDEDSFLGAQCGDLSACGGGEGLVGVGEDLVDQVDALGCGQERAVLGVLVEVPHEGVEPGVGDADVVGAEVPWSFARDVAEIDDVFLD